MLRNGFEQENDDDVCILQYGIRMACTGDLDALYALMEKYYDYDCHDFDRKKAKKAMRKLLGNRKLGTVLLVLDGSSKPIGYLVLAFGYSLEFGGRDAFIDEFFILQEYRGRKIGQAVLEHAHKVAKKAEVNALHLEVTRHNSAVIGFYRRNGFVDHDRYLMTKRTSP
ncbi:acetyltransferase [Candidatus Nitrososphaera evergladensis SR1]|jgi:ribosomal protein S18 acetylase RimI-like enzyme|uniref:Acetyltransferase n=1 Tax=Candidatus Nitrososphaera evergladensis SR1 TaxID=1459636 RepID=A0A075MRQ9_9ARCH|nr:GNAT family N-acetyltransferase [Candidatus Nitrososphaera evergladensis]AIF83848.1 acetyltransferase [Candidatus Nitrososphaera evergladensis SR1]